MASYRIYRLDGGGRLGLGETFEAESDGDAVVRAQALHRHGVASELWSGGRMVGRFSKLGVFTRGPG
ncbi:hypothetical protein LRS10_01250 [Phenylobacterium sp. J426]|uniref:hypothetical protein n=1 Tax=Phenylobacterium sp. J426 TaxID=2898439 RepID=UPI002150DAC5|nr:hypothetical protein [Phenylobacterium sp. J426]MCR5872943.1 hypothetical protein [Phenylobacterium sp. J426]